MDASASVTYGSTSSFSITASVAGVFTATSESTSYVKVSNAIGGTYAGTASISASAGVATNCYISGVAYRNTTTNVGMTFEPTDTTNYNSVTIAQNCAITVNKADISLTVSMSGWTYGASASNPSVSGNSGSGTVTYTYKVKDADDSTYTSTKPSSAGTYTVKASVVETTNYNAGTATTNFTISKASGSITGVSVSGTNRVGQTLTANRTYTGDGTLQYVWSRSSDGSSYSSITGATSQTYTLTTTDIGNYIKVTVSATAGTNYNAVTEVSDVTDATVNTYAQCVANTYTLTLTINKNITSISYSTNSSVALYAVWSSNTSVFKFVVTKATSPYQVSIAKADGTTPTGDIKLPTFVYGNSPSLNAAVSNTSYSSGAIKYTVTSIASYAFYTCSGLTGSLTIPDNVTSIDDNAFLNCSGLTSITINATTPPTLGSSVFTDTNSCPIYVPSDSVDAYKAASGWSDYASRILAEP